jgi:Fic family protein
MNALEQAEQLKNELDNLRPLNAEAEARIMQKFRLDWNYHSNNIEGNSLTYGETKALILFGITAQGKPLKDHFEITGHNEAINWVIDLVKGETELTEAFIRQLHALLLKESSYKEALTPDGKPTRRKIEVGKYKTMPNHVVTVTGETFYFATPEETPSRMHELLEWFRKERKKSDVNPIILAALFHYRFIRIHPFDDGNGRVARILMNFILMQFGYPPVIIKTEDKENYYAVLRLADADELEPFIEYIAQNLIRSVEIMIRGAKGESIEEPDDLDKEIALLERKVRTIGQKIEVQRSKDAIIKVFDISIAPLAHELFTEFRKFDKFYIQFDARISIDGRYLLGKQETTIHYAINHLNETESVPSIIEISYLHQEFSQDGFGKLAYETKLKIKFELTKFTVSDKEDQILYSKLYSEELTEEEIKKLVRNEKQKHLEFIKNKYEEIERNR